MPVFMARCEMDTCAQSAEINLVCAVAGIEFGGGKPRSQKQVGKQKE
jgi:hypothetical protein